MSNDIEKRLKGEQVHKTGPRGEALFCMTAVYQFILAVTAAAAFGDSWSGSSGCTGGRAAAASWIAPGCVVEATVIAAAASAVTAAARASTVAAASTTTVVTATATSTITTIPSTSTKSKATHILYSPFLLVCTISYGTLRQSVSDCLNVFYCHPLFFFS